ncbi:MAG TPA: glycoside hydrolase family 43 protein [Acidimicrobiales bacterium]|nr:glycoside hydrolase family 43 protein [Acidimicrobiales bacterium]
MGRRRRARLRRTLLVLAAAAVVAAGVVTDMRAHTRLARTRVSLHHARAVLGRDDAAVAALRYGRGLTSSQVKGMRSQVTRTAGELALKELALGQTNVSVYLQGVSIADLHTCLSGVQNAYGQITEHDNAGALVDLSGVSAACLSSSDSGAGLVYPFDFPDPFVLRVGSTYYAYATNSVGGNIQIIESPDLVNWTAVGDALPSLPAWAVPGGTWAPSVLAVGNLYVMYYSAEVRGSPGDEKCISAGVGLSPEGPFIDTSSSPLVCQSSLGGSIDPSPFEAPDGAMYLVWKSNGTATQAPEIWSQALGPDGTTLAGAGPTPILSPGQSWEGGNVEAPDMVQVNGAYLLFFSGNNWDTADYAVGVARCSGPLGPCSPWAEPILTSGANAVGPGGESVFFDASGGAWIAFHAWQPGAVGYPHNRELYIRRLNLSGPEPSVGGA